LTFVAYLSCTRIHDHADVLVVHAHKTIISTVLFVEHEQMLIYLFVIMSISSADLSAVLEHCGGQRPQLIYQNLQVQSSGKARQKKKA